MGWLGKQQKTVGCKVTKEEKEEMIEIVKQNMDYGNLSHFVRIAIQDKIKEVKEGKKQ